MSGTALGVTTGAVARRPGASPTTVRSWEQRYGIGPAVREGRRHRRWTPGDIAMLEEMCRLTSSGIPPAEAARAAAARRQPDAEDRGGFSAPEPAEAVAPPVGPGAEASRRSRERAAAGRGAAGVPRAGTRRRTARRPGHGSAAAADGGGPRPGDRVGGGQGPGPARGGP
ncbi:MerR family transcriptional regulator [Streptomyces sp. NPDC000075]|uniref:MerR family transcriptional regulator n=1 Tax=Streptomyces TaxID=1883 RepID=UPI0031DEE361